MKKPSDGSERRDGDPGQKREIQHDHRQDERDGADDLPRSPLVLLAKRIHVDRLAEPMTAGIAQLCDGFVGHVAQRASVLGWLASGCATTNETINVYTTPPPRPAVMACAGFDRECCSHVLRRCSCNGGGCVLEQCDPCEAPAPHIAQSGRGGPLRHR
jgi:hypothetical protein